MKFTNCWAVRTTVGSAFVAAVVGCSSTPSPEPPSADSVPEPPPTASATAEATTKPKAPPPKHAKIPACEKGDGSACVAAGLALAQGTDVDKDPPLALKLFDKGCSAGNDQACFNAGVMTMKGDGVPTDKARAVEYFKKACEQDHPQGCSGAGLLLYQGKGVTPDRKAAVGYFEKACRSKESEGCHNAAVMYLKGHGVTRNESKAKGLFEKACKGGYQASCKLVKQMDAQSGPSHAIAGANLTVDEFTANGLTLRQMSCRADGLGLFGSIAVAGGMAKRKRLLDACAPRGAAPVVTWSFGNNRITDVKTSGASKRVNSCVSRAIKGAAAPGNGKCAAMLLIGNKKGALAAAAKAAKK